MSTEAALPAWVWMWSLALMIYGVSKIVSWSTCAVSARAWKQLGYLIAWPGMDCDAFLRAHQDPHRSVRATEWLLALGKLGLGIVLVQGAATGLSDRTPLLRGWIGMVGIVFALHFGLFHLLSCAWRSAGICAAPLMNRPLLSRSVTEFWGRRWNRAFRDLTHQFLFLPCKRILSPAGALFAGFVVSGLIHDLVISWPSGGGWGLPTLYFAIQGAAVLVEHSRYGRACGIGTGGTGRLFCVATVTLPCPLLFHPPFVTNVMNPFLTALGGLA